MSLLKALLYMYVYIYYVLYIHVQVYTIILYITYNYRLFVYLYRCTMYCVFILLSCNVVELCNTIFK